MKLKTGTLSILFILSVFAVKAQDYKKNIEARFKEYSNFIVTAAFEKSMEYVPDTLFTVIPKDQMIMLMERAFNNPMLDFKILGQNITEVQDRKLIQGKYYALMRYTSKMSMFFKEDDDEKTIEDKKPRLQNIKTSLQSAFGSENVKLDEVTGVFEILAQKKACAIAEGKKAPWKFVVIDEKQRAMLEKILPKEVLDSK